MSDILDYIILVLVFAIIINVLMQAFGKKCNSNEHLEEQAKNVVHAEKVESESVNSELDNTPFDEPEKSEKVEKAVDKIVELKANGKCPIQETDYENDRYIKEFVLGGKFNCGTKAEEPKSFSRQEIKDYQDEVFGFNNNVNKSSSEGVDVVDKLNEIYTSRNNELDGNTGKKISEVFDRLTQNAIDRKKQCANPDCIIPPELDNQYRNGFYTENANMGKTYTRYNLRYETDDVNNGGKFYNDVEASDSEFESNLAWTK